MIHIKGFISFINEEISGTELVGPWVLHTVRLVFKIKQ
jgi:hypothetical protein